MGAHDGPEHIVSQLAEEVEELKAEFPVTDDETFLRAGLELADVVIYSAMLANRMGIDLEAYVKLKTSQNERRFPADLFTDGDFQTIYMARKKELGERA